jgi:hypothetical protein
MGRDQSTHRRREVLRTTVLVEPHGCVSSCVFAIRHEMQVGNVYSVRAAFEHALESDACKGSARLWVDYLRFCHDRKELRSKAKDVFYRAVHACPWSKELIMEAFTTLNRDMESSELRGLFSMKQTKGLRVHVDLDDFLGKWHEGEKSREAR